MGYRVAGFSSRNIYRGLEEAIDADHIISMSCTADGLVREVDILTKYVGATIDNKVACGRGNNLSQAIDSASNNYMYGTEPVRVSKGSLPGGELEEIDTYLTFGAKVEIEKQFNNWIYVTISARGHGQKEVTAMSVEEGLKKLEKELSKNKAKSESNTTKHDHNKTM
ncbi:MAG: hypothetical protein PHS45_01495 [Bacilli bacterium]|nr:hypothetical protein [Bacilli bacterium]